MQCFLPMIIVRCEMRCKMCRERVPGYKYFIFTDEDVTLKVWRKVWKDLSSSYYWRWTTIHESCGQRVCQVTHGEDLKSSFSTSSLGSVFAGIQQTFPLILTWPHLPLEVPLAWGGFSEGSIFWLKFSHGINPGTPHMGCPPQVHTL